LDALCFATEVMLVPRELFSHQMIRHEWLIAV